MTLKALITLHGTNINEQVKCLCAKEFADNIEEIVDFLKTKKPGRVPSETVIQNEITNHFKEKYDILSINDKRYPKLLKKINIAPVLLSVKGSIDFLQSSTIGLVGSRKLDTEDFSIIREIVRAVNDLDIGIISGLAHGSDIVAQIQSLKAGTITVLPCGFKYCYPLEYEKIIDKIIDFGGTVVSEFFFSEPPRKVNFVKRNAVIAGISEAMILTRARTLKCGSMISANYANSFKKTIYTLIFNGENDGNKFLLEKNQAIRVTSFEKLKYSILCDIANNEINYNLPDNSKEKEEFNKKINLFTESANKKKTIKDKVEDILCSLNFEINASKIPYVYDLCCKDNSLSVNDKQKILIMLLEKFL